MFEFLASSDFVKNIQKLDPAIQKQIKEKLRFLQETENPLLFAKKLKGYKNIFRFRAGNLRMVVRLEQQKIILLFVKHRKDIYEGL